MFTSRKEDTEDIGGIEFADFTIKETTNRPLMKFYNVSGHPYSRSEWLLDGRA